MGDFYTTVNKEPEFRYIVIISGDYPLNGYCVCVVISKRDVEQERTIYYDQGKHKVL
jgi:hypothetical protein